MERVSESICGFGRRSKAPGNRHDDRMTGRHGRCLAYPSVDENERQPTRVRDTDLSLLLAVLSRVHQQLLLLVTGVAEQERMPGRSVIV